MLKVTEAYLPMDDKEKREKKKTKTKTIRIKINNNLRKRECVKSGRLAHILIFHQQNSIFKLCALAATVATVATVAVAAAKATTTTKRNFLFCFVCVTLSVLDIFVVVVLACSHLIGILSCVETMINNNNNLNVV